MAKSKSEQAVDRYLDGIELDRMEWERVMDDMYPTGVDDPEVQKRTGKVHRDTDQIQKWMREQRRKNYEEDNS
mgnify:FL=1